MKKTKREFFDPKLTMSYHAPLTMVVSMRSYGKTYGFTKAAIRDYIRKGEQFVYVRRYGAELKKSFPKIFDDIAAHNEFPGYVFKVVGEEGFIARDPHVDDPDSKAKPAWDKICFAIPLSSQANYKGVAFPKVTKIIFDEFIRVLRTPPGYLRDDVGAFLDLYKTVSRDRENVYAYLLGNSCDLTNPYFIFAGINDEPNDGFTWYRNKTILLNYAKNVQFANEERETIVGRLVAGTPYEGVMIDNVFANAGDEFIAKKPKTAKFLYAFHFQSDDFGVWLDYKEGIYYVNKQVPKNIENEYKFFTLTAEDMKPNLIMIERASPFIKSIIRFYSLGVCRFDSPATRERYLRMMRLVGLR